MNVEKGEIKILAAMASNADPAAPYTTGWTIGRNVREAQAQGYHGSEFWSMRPFPYLQIKTGLILPHETDGIYSAHQSVTGDHLNKRKPRDLMVSLAFEHKNRSLNSLLKLKNRTGDIPVVLFETTPRRFHQESGFSTRGIQIQPELLEHWEVSTAKDFWEKAKDEGFTAIVPDTHHMRRPSNKNHEDNPFRDLDQSLPEVLPYADEFHACMGRGDFGEMDKQVIYDEAVDMLNGGKNDTALVRAVRTLKETKWSGLLVTEIRPKLVAEAMGHTGKFVPLDVLRELNKKIVFTIRNILQQ